MSESSASARDDVGSSAEPVRPAASAGSVEPAPDGASAQTAAEGAGPVQTAVRSLVADAPQRPIEEHPDLFEQAHQTLRDALAAAGD